MIKFLKHLKFKIDLKFKIKNLKLLSWVISYKVVLTLLFYVSIIKNF